MFSFVNRPLDRWVIRAAAAKFRPPRVQDSRILQTAELLQSSDFFCDSIQTPEEVFFNDPHGFRFRSLLLTGCEDNDFVHGRLYRAGRNWQARPAVILIHGWNGEYGYEWLFPWLARRLNAQGVNVAMLELPYHGRRKPRSHGAIRNFISSDLFHTVQAARQAVADIRALLGWLLGQGSPAVGLWGVSMGGWLAGLVASHEPRTKFAVLMSPLVDLEDAIETLPFCEPIQVSLKGGTVPLRMLNLQVARPLPAPGNILIVEALDDQFVPPESVENVWRAWNQPELWRVKHGHISILLSLPVLERTTRWIAKRAETVIRNGCSV